MVLRLVVGIGHTSYIYDKCPTLNLYEINPRPAGELSLGHLEQHQPTTDKETLIYVMQDQHCKMSLRYVNYYMTNQE